MGKLVKFNSLDHDEIMSNIPLVIEERYIKKVCFRSILHHMCDCCDYAEYCTIFGAAWMLGDYEAEYDPKTQKLSMDLYIDEDYLKEMEEDEEEEEDDNE